MKFKKAGLADILSFVMIFTLFTGLMLSMLFNNITQERRSMMIDFINTEAMTLQAKLKGYSEYDAYCFMYDGNGRIDSRDRMEEIKKDAIDKAKANIEREFLKPRNAGQLKLDSVDINITDSVNAKDSAKVTIVIKYTASFRSPFNKENGAKGDSKGLMNVKITDTASRIIENPTRQKNI